ncbi:DUF7455 domain-containing protein [Actinomyces vulturis]|uniref:DUF7455 domain-containing protein n=1 Tax=Actinomyces vulturis TaxID=1857645 RepID=UPI00082C3214|nr:hypothetical protein [Actinomyces vulturis]
MTHSSALTAENPQAQNSEHEATLTTADRCDACGAQAFVRVTMTKGPLYFCAHHWHAHEEGLRPVATDILDETDRLTTAV